MMRTFRRLAVLATAADAVRRFARNNPEKFNQVVQKAARFVDQRTKGKYSTQIGGVTQKVRDVTGANGSSAPSAPSAPSPTSTPSVTRPSSQQRS